MPQLDRSDFRFCHRLRVRWTGVGRQLLGALAAPASAPSDGELMLHTQHKAADFCERLGCQRWGV